MGKYPLMFSADHLEKPLLAASVSSLVCGREHAPQPHKLWWLLCVMLFAWGMNTVSGHPVSPSSAPCVWGKLQNKLCVGGASIWVTLHPILC